MAPRRSHKKSRTGCQSCKRRRIKCDEVHPACGNCVKHAIVCDFSLYPKEHARAASRGPQEQSRVSGAAVVSSAVLHASPPPPRIITTSSNLPTLELMVSLPSPEHSHIHHPSPAAQDHAHVRVTPSISPIIAASTVAEPVLLNVNSSSAAVSPASPPLPSPFPAPNQLVLPPFHGISPPATHQTTFNVVDLALMHQWATSTADTISNHRNIQQLWRLNIPVLAIHHPFLMHGLLALSAIHLHSQNPDHSNGVDYLAAAAHHHERAVRGMASSLAHISRDNCDALVVSSCVVVIYSFVSSRMDEAASRPGLDPAKIASWVPLLRGVHSILKQAWNWVTGGPLSPLIRQYELSSNTEGLDQETEGVLQSLYRLCTDRSLPGSEELSDTSISTAYFSAIAELRKSFATISEWESIIGSIFIWPITTADKFVELLVERRPRALVIFMHYCALFTLVEEFWWSKGSALFELRRCEACLSEEWIPWIEWPKERILAKDVDKVVSGGVPQAALSIQAMSGQPAKMELK